MSRTQRRGASGARLLPLVAPLALGLLLAAALAWQAHAAGRAHRAAVEQVVRDQADFAAFLLLRVARETLALRALYGFAPVLRSEPVDSALPPVAVLGTDPVEARRCPLPGGGRLYARYRVSTAALTLAGDSADAATRRWLSDTLAVLAQNDTTGVRHVLRADGAEPRLFSYAIMRDGKGTALAAYAANGCFATGDTTDVFRDALRSTSALPPSLTAGVPNDSLLSAVLRAPAGDTLWRSRHAWAGDIRGAAGPDPVLGGAVLEVTLRPEAVDRLVAGGLPPSRLPQSLALLAAAAILATVAVVQAHRQLALARLRERFVRNASHELRTPLQQILLYADLLRLGALENDAERREALDVIDTETRRLIQRVDGVLRFTRGESVAEAVERGPAISLATVVAEAVEAFRPLAAARDARIELDIEGDPPVHGPPDTIRQVLLNLLDNAVKFGPRGQTVHVAVESTPSHTRLRVEDEGPGIPAADRTRVFEPFVRLERDERDGTPGTGVGLAVVADLVRRDGGIIDVTDRPGGGARIAVEWPAP